MPFLPRAQFDELLALQRDVREGRLVRRETEPVFPGKSVAEIPAFVLPTEHRTGSYGEMVAADTAKPRPLSLGVMAEVNNLSRGNPEERQATYIRAQKLAAQGEPDQEIVRQIRRGRTL